jgi:hypothetical protein
VPARILAKAIEASPLRGYSLSLRGYSFPRKRALVDVAWLSGRAEGLLLESKGAALPRSCAEVENVRS